MRVASDVGGTFTDLVYYKSDRESSRDEDLSSQFGIAKTDTTPPNFETGVLNAIAKAGIDPSEFEFFAHGCTVVINTLTERKGAKTALVTTKGFRDVLEIGRSNRPDLFNFDFQKPKAFIDRYLRTEVDERVDYKGNILKEPDTSQLESLIDFFRAEGVEAIAICFMHAYVNPSNEAMVADKIRDLAPELSVIASNEISREWREYERTSTTALSAYVHPVTEKYLDLLQSELDAADMRVPMQVMQSNSGISSVNTAKKNPISIVESGPASGIFAAAYLGNLIGENNLIALDIGGTTAKCTLIKEGEIEITTQYFIERDGKTPGYPIQTPVSEIVEIGNGGGSIAWIDKGGKLHVGPQSAGAMPGPASYGKGGTRPTTTDANLVLGRIDKSSFVGGEIEPDMEAVEAAFKPLMDELGTGIEDMARGVIRIANFNMTNALRLVSTNKGYDPREFSLIAFGGGGAMHAVELAEELNVPKVIVPVNSSVFSAWGMLLTDLRRDYLLTNTQTLSVEHQASFKTTYQALEDQARKDSREDNSEESLENLGFRYLADLRYEGQEHTVKIPFPTSDSGEPDIETAKASFHEAHKQRFTYEMRDNNVEIVNFHLVATIPVDKPELSKKAVTGIDVSDAILHTRPVDFDKKGIHEATIYDGLKLEPGMTLSGPAVVQEPSATLVISPNNELSVDDYGNYQVLINPQGLANGGAA